MSDLMVSVAIAFAARVHAGSLDKQGEPYILHPLRVMLQFTGTVERVAAVLHDVVEDGDVTLKDIETTFGREVADVIAAVSRRQGETYEQFILRASQHPIGRRIKLADVRDNFERLPTLRDERERERLARRYRMALKVLEKTFRFNVSDRVKIVRLLDTLSNPALVGHVVVIQSQDWDAFPWVCNYETRCETCEGHHYVHEDELGWPKEEER